MKTIRLFAGGLAVIASMSFYATNSIAEPYVEQLSNGSMNWNSGEASATGIGVPPEKYMSNPARARAMAVRAAKVDATRNLLELLEGVRVQSQTLVKDMAVESDLIRTTMAGTVRNASMVGSPHYMDDGSVEVVMAINYRKSVAAQEVIKLHRTQTLATSEKTNAHTAETTHDDAAPAASGLIIDAVGKGLKTALAPRILDEDGNVIYSGSMVAEDKQADMVAYDTSASDAAKLPRLGGNAITIKAVKVIDKTDVVISNSDAAKIVQTAGMQETLRQARVAFAL